jgi:hypothetical protein
MIEVEERYVIKSLDAKKFALNGIVTGLTLAHREQVHAKKAVEY